MTCVQWDTVESHKLPIPEALWVKLRGNYTEWKNHAEWKKIEERKRQHHMHY